MSPHSLYLLRNGNKTSENYVCFDDSFLLESSSKCRASLLSRVWLPSSCHERRKEDWLKGMKKKVNSWAVIDIRANNTVLSRIPFLKEELGASSFHSFEVTCLERCIPCVRWKEGIWAWKSETLKDMEAEEWAVSCKSWQSRGVPGSFKKFWKTFFDWLQSLFYISSCIL